MLRPAGTSPMKSAKKKPTAANLRSWRVIIMRSKGEYLGSVEAPDRERAGLSSYQLGSTISCGCWALPSLPHLHCGSFREWDSCSADEPQMQAEQLLK
jgi:hypothetical protein